MEALNVDNEVDAALTQAQLASNTAAPPLMSIGGASMPWYFVVSKHSLRALSQPIRLVVLQGLLL